MIARKTIRIAFAAMFASLALASTAHGSIGIESFTTTSSTQQAGTHPDLSMEFTLEDPGAPEAARNIAFNAPEGVFGNPTATPRCEASEFALSQCSPNTQVGLMTVRANYEGNPSNLLGTAPIYNMVPNGDEDTARFAFVVPSLGIAIHIPVKVRTAGDYGLRFTVSEISQLTPLAAAKSVFWGLPNSTIHNSDRFPYGSPGNPPGCPGDDDTSCLAGPTPPTTGVQAFINYPSECTGQPLVTRLAVESYQDPGDLSEAQSSYTQTVACEKQVFQPVLFARPTSKEADSASGLDLTLRAAQAIGFVPSPSPMKSVTVTFPSGFTINPDAADGQSDCTDAEAQFDSEGPAACPDNSKVGIFNIHSPSLEGPLRGSAYLGRSVPGDPYRLFLIADGFGIHAKLLGSIQPDPSTGQLRAVFADLPQVSFEEIELHLFASDRGLMATPTHCSIYNVEAEFHPWNTKLAPQSTNQVFSVNSGPNGSLCPGQIRPFKPRLEAGSSNPTAGAFSDFHLKLDRDDGDQFLGDLNFTMPPGFTGSLRGLTYCPEPSITAATQRSGRDELLAASCPPSSEVGTSNVAAGPGTHPFHAKGRMYLSGPLKGAPLSLVAITPALAGPYDYGNVVVRVALNVDPLTAQVRAVSETMPQIIGGIPIRMRSIEVNIDKPNFTINPTNCSPFTVESEGIGDQGTAVGFSSPFTAVNCALLPFQPKMTVRQVGSRKGTRRTVNPRLQFDLRTRAGDANIKSVAVTLPKSFEIDQRHLGNICSEKELATNQCAGRTAIGRASTTTPLLDQPLSGPAYAVSGSGGLPRLAFILNGQVNLVPRADTVTVGGRLKTTVPVVPDAPIGHFRLTIFDGKTGYLVNTRNLCKSISTVKVGFTAQNGKRLTQHAPVKAVCGKSKARGKRKH